MLNKKEKEFLVNMLNEQIEIVQEDLGGGANKEMCSSEIKMLETLKNKLTKKVR